jgi:hypothetical protein
LNYTVTPILATWEAESRRISVQGQLGQIVFDIPFPKITRVKRTGGAVQAIERLLCKYEAINSNPSHPNK